jgi:RecA/RadA recombinase
MKKAPDFQDEIISALNRIAPKEDSGLLWEVARTTDIVLSEVKYSLMTGIPSFDSLIGGMPIGRIIELFGLESCGKTAMAIRCAAQAHLGRLSEISRDADDRRILTPLDPEDCDIAVFYIDNEQSLDEDNKIWFEGKKLDAVGFRCATTDHMFKAIDKVIDVAEQRIEKMPKKKVFTVIIVDTIASTPTSKEMDQPWGTQDYPRVPLEISNALRKLTRRVNQHNVALLFTNQVRGKFQQQQQRGRTAFTISPDDYKSPGGFALRFYATHRVFMYAEQMKYRLLPTARFHAGVRVGFHSMKNRIRMPRRTGKMVLLFDEKKGGFNSDFSLLETLIDLGFIEVKAKEKGCDFVCKFSKSGITPKTFDGAQTTTSLDEDDDSPMPRRGSSRKDPGFRYRAHWPQFYADHKADVDALWEKAVSYAMTTEGLEGEVSVQEVDESERTNEVED